MAGTESLPELQDLIGDRYALERQLGRGGMGTVWLARDLRLDRPVALKVLHNRFATDPTARERFIREARTAAGLAHPHIVPIFGVEVRGDLAFLVMAMIDVRIV
ncbi:MAG TPA: protein kinase, partial [Gemmatimonadales bacterium]|nr:protein kinase [Gemmatimonadales bacterium]